MKLKTKSTIAVICLVLVYIAAVSIAWDTVTLDVPRGANEAVWRDALAEKWDGVTEVKVLHGRIDVETDLYVVELDFMRKWHEGLAQALHYSHVTGKQGVVALIVKEPYDKAKLMFIEKLCNKYNVRLVVLKKGEK